MPDGKAEARKVKVFPKSLSYSRAEPTAGRSHPGLLSFIVGGFDLDFFGTLYATLYTRYV